MEHPSPRGGPRPGRRPAPQDRRRPLAQGRPRGLDRALPEGHRPAQGRPAVPRARPPLRGGRLALHAHRATTCSRSTRPRRRCASPSGSARPRAASRAHGIFGRVFGRIGDSERARQNLERSVELARESDPGEAVRALLTLGYHLEVSEADYEGAGEAYREALELAEQTGDLPSQVELHAALAQLAAHRGDWEASSARPRRRGEPRRARGPDRKALLPLRDARGAPLARGRLRRGGQAAHARRRAGRAGGPLGGCLPVALLALARRSRQRGDHADADTELARALDLCERAGLVAQSVEAISARAVNLALWRQGRGRARGRRRGRAAGGAPALPGRPAPPASRPAARPPPIRRKASACSRRPGRRGRSSADRSMRSAVRRSPRGSPRPALRPRTPAGSPRTAACGPARRGGSRSPCPGSPGRFRRSPR